VSQSQAADTADTIADDYLAQTAHYHWAGLAQAIREKHSDSRVTGETVARAESEGVVYEISESFYWANEPEGDIVHALRVHTLGSANVGHRQRLISRES